MNRLVAAFVICAALASAHAHAGTRAAKCLLEIGGTAYINGRCPVMLQADGSFMVGADGETEIEGYFAVLNVTGKDVGEGYWNEEPGAGHAQTSLGTMRRDGACWVNKSARICAWR